MSKNLNNQHQKGYEDGYQDGKSKRQKTWRYLKTWSEQEIQSYKEGYEEGYRKGASGSQQNNEQMNKNKEQHNQNNNRNDQNRNNTQERRADNKTREFRGTKKGHLSFIRLHFFAKLCVFTFARLRVKYLIINFSQSFAKKKV